MSTQLVKYTYVMGKKTASEDISYDSEYYDDDGKHYLIATINLYKDDESGDIASGNAPVDLNVTKE